MRLLITVTLSLWLVVPHHKKKKKNRFDVPLSSADIQQKALPLFDLQKWLAALCLGMIQNKLVKVNKVGMSSFSSIVSSVYRMLLILIHLLTCNLFLAVSGEKAVRIFSYNELRRATHDFSGANKIGEGGFGSVFRVMYQSLWSLQLSLISILYYIDLTCLKFILVDQGRLRDGTIVAVKVLSATSRQGVREFINELTAISDVMHENLITLVGCCAEGSHRILVYNYLENNSLQHTLLGNILVYLVCPCLIKTLFNSNLTHMAMQGQAVATSNSIGELVPKSL